MPTPAKTNRRAKRESRIRQLVLRAHETLFDKIDAWSATQEDEPLRAEAVRRLVKLGLKVNEASHAKD
jgi:hypothetical protein